jgi:hypothetical protein
VFFHDPDNNLIEICNCEVLPIQPLGEAGPNFCRSCPPRILDKGYVHPDYVHKGYVHTDATVPRDAIAAQRPISDVMKERLRANQHAR